MHECPDTPETPGEVTTGEILRVLLDGGHIDTEFAEEQREECADDPAGLVGNLVSLWEAEDREGDPREILKEAGLVV